jgi:uncharacterized protein YijF (DUF1287 family)
MTKHILIREVRREEVDLQKLAHALLRLARERLSQSQPTTDTPASPEHDDE